MDHATTEIRTEQWRQIVLEANGSFQTKKEFCRQNGEMTDTVSITFQ